MRLAVRCGHPLEVRQYDEICRSTWLKPREPCLKSFGCTPLRLSALLLDLKKERDHFMNFWCWRNYRTSRGNGGVRTHKPWTLIKGSNFCWCGAYDISDRRNRGMLWFWLQDKL